MAAFNLTLPSPSTFILSGIPGLEAAHIWISIPFCTFYIMCLLGNVTILLVVGKEQTLHKPMYLLLCMLALTDIFLSTCVLPKALGIFWFGFKETSVNGCIIQMFFVHMVIVMHSAILMIMALDRYVAICEPLRYSTILTNVRLAKLGVMGLIRAFLLILPLPLLLWRLPFCASHIIHHTFCEHMAVLKLSCGDTTINQRYSLFVVIFVSGLDLTLIFLSYALIIRAVLRISSNKDSLKALNTCTAHICVMTISHSSSIFTSLTHRFGQGISAHVHIIIANLYVVIPPMLNPIIYAVTTKELRNKIGKYICRMGLPGTTGIKPT